MIRVYTASKFSSAAFWRDLDQKWPDVYFHARWLKHNAVGTAEDSPENARTFWLEDVEDVVCADALLLYARRGEHLRGALVEVGVAIAHGIPVVVVGEHPDYDTWQYHPAVLRTPDFDAAHATLRKLYISKRVEQEFEKS